MRAACSRPAASCSRNRGRTRNRPSSRWTASTYRAPGGSVMHSLVIWRVAGELEAQLDARKGSAGSFVRATPTLPRLPRGYTRARRRGVGAGTRGCAPSCARLSALAAAAFRRCAREFPRTARDLVACARVLCESIARTRADARDGAIGIERDACLDRAPTRLSWSAHASRVARMTVHGPGRGVAGNVMRSAGPVAAHPVRTRARAMSFTSSG
jgi:hypothetical protein